VLFSIPYSEGSFLVPVAQAENNLVMIEFDVDKTVQYWSEGAEYDMVWLMQCIKRANIRMLCLWDICRWKSY